MLPDSEKDLSNAGLELFEMHTHLQTLKAKSKAKLEAAAAKHEEAARAERKRRAITLVCNG